jgi:DNA (cytosine-5)-methyltransferase 1
MIKLLSLFSGIGAFEKALKNLKIDYETINYCEIDKFASKSYCLIHNEDENKNLWDITKVNEKELKDFDLMTYGFPCQPFSVTGLKKGFDDQKKGNLFFESMRIVKYKKPKYMIAENVKGLLLHNNGQTLQTIVLILDNLGYNNYFNILNAKNYNIPQNRDRLFIISIRKDIDDLIFDFPKKQKLVYRLNRLLENGTFIYDRNFLKSREKRGDKCIFYDYSPTLLTNCGNLLYIDNKRKITCLECMRLNGFTDYDYDKIKNKISERQIYKQCGNSIVVNVLEAIFKQLFLSDKKRKWLF